MTNHEVNKTIAEFMGIKYTLNAMCSTKDFYAERDGISWIQKRYTESLDALIPVWDKLEGKACIIELGVFHRTPWARCENSGENITPIENGDTIQEAAAAATAKAILELQND